MNELMNDKDVCRTAPSTPGLLNILCSTNNRPLEGKPSEVLLATLVASASCVNAVGLSYLLLKNI